LLFPGVAVILSPDMAPRVFSRWVVPWVVLACLVPAARADTNAVADAPLFFRDYRQAARLAKDKKDQEAGLVLDALAKKLGSAPWLEIALLKSAELIETRNEKVAVESYQLLRQRLQNAPYYQGDAERARLFRSALGGAIEAGINRIHVRRVRLALERYHGRYLEYPESLAKLAVLGYTEPGNILDANERPLRYVPGGLQMTPFISYKRYDGLDTTPPEPLQVSTPRLDGTSQVSTDPVQYALLVSAAGRHEPLRLVENQTHQGYLIAAIGHDGAILLNFHRVLVLLTPD
jgi:hypothetical protein